MTQNGDIIESKEVAIQIAPLPFSQQRVRHTVPQGHDIAFIVAHLVPSYLHGSIRSIVTIDGRPIIEGEWITTVPQEGQLVNIRVVPMGGGGKNPLSALLSIAVLVAAPYLASTITLSALNAGLGLSVGQGIMLGKAIAAGFSVLASLAINSLFSTPKQSGATSNPSTSPTQFIEGASNQLNPYGVIPICLGTNRMFPLQAARPYTETVGNDQYVRQLFTYGFGNKVVISSEKIGDTSIEEYDDIEIEHFTDGDLHTGSKLYPGDVNQVDMNVLLQEEDSWTVRTAPTDADEISVDFTFPSGLCQFNAQAKRLSFTVNMEVQYAPTGTSNWSPGVSSYKAISGTAYTLANTFPASSVGSIGANMAEYVHLVCIDPKTGAYQVVKGSTIYFFSYAPKSAVPPKLPSGMIGIAQVRVQSTRAGATRTFTDIRQPSLYGKQLQNSGSFAPSWNATTLTIAAGGIKTTEIAIKASIAETVRRSYRIKLPARGDYDVRVRRITEDTDSDQIIDDVYLSAIRTFTNRNPVAQPGLNGTAARMRATDQLNGTVDQWNVICSNVIPDYDEDSGNWVDSVTSNPASIYLFVLQGGANARPVPESRVIREDFEAWHTYCVECGYSYNRVIDYDTSVEELLRDIAAAGSASPAIVDGKRTIVVDRDKDDIVQVVTPRNSSSYSGEMIYPVLPHAFRMQFRNADKDYQQDERLVYNDGYSAANATLFETIEVQSCTDAALAYKIGRRYFAAAKLRPESHTFTMDVENLVAIRGDRIVLEHDIPIVGVGDGRISAITTDNTDPDNPLVTSVTLDDVVGIPTDGTYYLRIRCGDGTQIYKEVMTTIGEMTEFAFVDPFPLEEEEDEDGNIFSLPAIGDLALCLEAGGQLDLVITNIQPQEDLSAVITAINYAPEIFTAETGSIPEWQSLITTPLSLTRPKAPLFAGAVSDETAAVLNLDGTVQSRAIITLTNPNGNDVLPEVRVRRSGDTEFGSANLLEATPERIVMTGLDAGVQYDIHVRYRRAGGSIYSKELQLNNFTFIGVSSLPADVTGFKIEVSGNTAIVSYNPNTDIDLDGYELRLSGAYLGAEWGTSQFLLFTTETRVTLPFQGGTLLIKAKDLSGNYSENATAIITYNPGVDLNAIEILEEAPDFVGAKDNVVVRSGHLQLRDEAASTGYYYFSQGIDLGEVFSSILSATVVAGGNYINDIFDIPDVFEVEDIFGSGQNDVFEMADMFEINDVFGIGLDAWSVELQYRYTSENPWFDPDAITQFPIDIDNAYWTKTSGSITANTATAPDGTLTADKFVGNAGFAVHMVSRATSTTTPGDVMSMRAYVKNGGLDRMTLQAVAELGPPYNTEYSFRLFFNLDTGELYQSDGTTLMDYSIIVRPDGWVEVTMTCTPPPTLNPTGNWNIYATRATDYSSGFNSDGVSGFLIWDWSCHEGGAFDPYTAWEPFAAGTLEFRAIQYRLLMTTNMPNVTPEVSELTVTVDMPDRIERGEDIAVNAVTGATITYPQAFRDDPAVVITIQDGDANDEIEYVYKNASGFQIKIWNTTAASYVSRSIDFVASGYGRVTA